MNTAVTVTPADLYNILLAASACIITVSGAIGVIVKWVQAAKKPNETQNERLDSIERRLDRHEEMLVNDDKRQKDLEEGNRVTMEALLALLRHGIDGNDIDSMKNAEKDLRQYLTRR